MYTLIKKKKINLFFIIVTAIFSFSINFYYSNIGTFPIDTFLHYDSSYRILNKEYPVKDFWIVSGFVVDFIQSFFFRIFGVNWNSYIIHSSLFNLLMSLLSYHFFISLKISHFASFIYAICFATLAYTVSGTPFVDHHATFFLLTGTFLIFRALQKNDLNYLWPLIVFVYFLSFLSKQVPVTYAVILQGSLILILIIKEKSFNIIWLILFSTLVLIFSFLIFLFFLKIDFSLFLTQYIYYPRSIGLERFFSLDKSFISFFNEYKFIIIPIIFTLYLKIRKKNLYFRELINYLIILSFGVSLLYHQTLTRNQIYIYFLVPVFFSLLHSEIILKKNNLKKIFSTIIILSVILITLKYHFRYNENRKFHDLTSLKIENSIDAKNLNSSFKQLKWVNPLFEGLPQDELKLLQKGQKILMEDKDQLMLISHYLFFEIITNKEMNYPNRTFTSDGASYPSKKFNKTYKFFFEDLIKKKTIKNIYFFKHENISQKIVKDYLEPKCFKLKENDIFYIYEIENNCLK